MIMKCAGRIKRERGIQTPLPGNVTTAAPPTGGCSHYSGDAPVGSGDHSSAANAGDVSTAWPKMTAGETLCLINGEYTGDNSMIQPPEGLSGTASAYITIKALNDGQVFINGQGAREPVVLNNNRYVILEGFTAHDSNGDVIAITNTQCPISDCTAAPVVIMRRVVGYDASSSTNDVIILTNASTFILFEDIAAWGTGRKVFQPYRSHHITFRRAFGVMGGTTATVGPGNPIVQEGASISYESYFVTFENSIMSWNQVPDMSLENTYAILTFARIDGPDDPEGIFFPTYGFEANGKVLGQSFLCAKWF